MSRLRRWLCPHTHRDQGIVGYCQRCGHFRETYIGGGMWTRYVRPLPPGFVLPAVGGMPPSIAAQRAAIALEREKLALERERQQ